MEQARFTLPERAGGAGQQGAAGQAKQNDQFHHRETTAALLIGRLRETFLIGGGVGEPEAGTVHNLEGPAAQASQGGRALGGGLGAGPQRRFQKGLWQPCPGLTVATGILVHGGAAVERT